MEEAGIQKMDKWELLCRGKWFEAQGSPEWRYQVWSLWYEAQKSFNMERNQRPGWNT